VSRLLVVSVLAAAIVIVSVLTLIRTRRLQERYAIGWLLGSVAVAILGAWSNGLAAFSRLMGIATPALALFLVIVVFLALVLLDTVIVLSRSVQRNRVLAQKVAMLQERLDRLEAPRPPDQQP
jgi:hypothetical protein